MCGVKFYILNIRVKKPVNLNICMYVVIVYRLVFSGIQNILKAAAASIFTCVRNTTLDKANFIIVLSMLKYI